WSVTDGPNVGSINVSDDNLEVTSGTTPGIYEITFNLTNTNIGPDCPLTSNFSFEIIEEPFADITPIGQACNEDTGTDPDFLDLDDFNPNGASGTWSTVESGIVIDADNIVDFRDSEVKDYAFTFTTITATSPCSDQSYSLTITVNDCKCPSVEIGALDNICLEPTIIDLTTIKVSTEDGFWSVTDGPNVGSINVSDDNLEVTSGTTPGIYEITFNLTDTNIGPDCDQSSSTTIEILEEPSADIIPFGNACNIYTGTDPDNIDLDIFNPQNASGVWSSEDMTIDADNVVNFLNLDVQDYTFTFITNTAQLPCQDQAYTTIVTVNDCSCPSVEILPIDNQCIEDNLFDLNNYKVTSEDGTWSIANGPDVSSLDLSGDQLSILENSVPGIYTIQFTLDDQDIGPLCELSSEFQFELIEKPSANILTQAVACNENTGAEPDFVDLDDLNPDGAPGTWESVDASLIIDSDNIVSFAGIDVESYEFIFTTDSAVAPCEEVSYTASIAVKDCACPAILVEAPGNFCQEDNMFNLDELIIDADPGVWSIIGGFGDVPTIQNQMLIISETTSIGDYMLMYSLSDTNVPANCLLEVEVPFSLFQTPEADITAGAEVCDNYIGSLETTLDLNTLYNSGSTGVWTSTDGSITIDSDNIVDFTDAAPGDYEFVYTTNTAMEPCEDVAYSSMITVNECDCPILMIDPIDDLCNTENIIDLTSYLTASQSGTWTLNSSNGGIMPTLFNQSQIIIDETTAPGEYELVFEFDDINFPSLCTVSESIIFTIIEQPEAQIITGALACNVDASIIASDVIDLDDMFSGGSSGNWETGASITINADNTVSFNGESPGDYLFIYKTDSAIFPCVEQEYELIITVEDCACPILAFSSVPELCNDEIEIDLSSFLLTQVGDGTWAQTDGPSTSGFSGGTVFEIMDMPAGDYEFEFTLDEAVPAGCDQSDLVIVTLNQSPQLTVEDAITVCNQNSSLAPLCIDLNALMSGDDGSWVAPPSYTNDFSDVSNVCFDDFEEGLKFLFSYTTNSAVAPCINKTESIEVTVMDCSCPNIEVEDPSPLCSIGDMINLSDLETPNTVDGSWSYVSGPENVNLGNTEVFDATNVTSGNYIFMFTPNNTPEPLCPQASQINVEVITPLNAGFGNTVDYCEKTDLEVTLFNLLDDADQGGQWTEISSVYSTESAFDETNGTFNIVDQVPGTYEFKYEHIGFEPCPDSEAVVTITILANPIADAGLPTIITCSNTDIILGGDNLSKGPRLIYEWTEESGLAIDEPDIAHPTIYQAGTYKVVVTDIIFGCQSEDEVVITEDIGFPTFDTEILPFDCGGQNSGTILVQNSVGGNGDYIYTIDDGQTWTEDAEFSDLPPGSYTITLQDGNGCEATVSGLVINDRINLNLDLGGDVEITYGENYYPLQVQSDALPSEIDSIIWTQDGEVICEGDYDSCSIIEVDPEGVTTFCARVVDINGCEESDCVVIREILEVNVYLANVFTPEISDFNNRFFVQTDENITSVKSFRIFDRWGSQVFEGEEDHLPNDPDFGWDGIWKDGRVRAGVYTYHVVVIDALESEHKFVGSITLLN
ncbi:MAG: hypothetical protein HKN51_12225, partial [Saprospiraceae bacterium]|nr:hypothetical protein [Saprospiraceae bacterium]